MDKFDQSGILKQPGRFWGFGYLRSRTEKLVAGKLGAAGVGHYLPLIPKARMHHASRVVSMMPMIPGYVFVCLNDDERYEWKRTCEQFIQIELMRDRYNEDTLVNELNALKKCEALAREMPVVVNPGIRRGDRVEIVSGPLKGLVTDVVRRNDRDNAIIVNLTILNRSVECPVSAEMLKKITG